MDFKLIWTAKATIDLEDIVQYYVREERNPLVAAKVGKAIFARVEILQVFPDIGPLYPREVGPYREIFCYRYRIFYRVSKKTKEIFIVRIWHGNRDISKLDL